VLGAEAFCRRTRLTLRFDSPAPHGDHCPDGLDHPEGPCPLQESIGRTERTGDRKAKDVPGTAVFERIEDEHGRYREQPEGRERVHL
jgi:hypothetical protein